ncbi:MAG: DHH family phosphoesterase [Candidatus Thorarchaeota archaeon]
MINSITHELDLDGLGSQAIIRRFFKLNPEKKNNKFNVQYAHYTNFMGIVIETLNSIPPDGQIVISDIGFNDEFKLLFPLFEKVKRKNCKIFWFDHHIIDEIIEKKIKKVIELYINDSNRCTAEIVKDYYLHNDPIAIKIASYSRDIDFNEGKYEIATKLQSIIAFNRGDKLIDNKKKIVEMMSNGIFENDWYSEQLAKIKVWEEKESQFAINHTEILNVKEFGNFIISFAKIGGGKIVNLLRDHFPEMKLYIGIDIRYNEIIIHSDYLNCRELARNFKGGGHKNRAGFKFEDIFTNNYEISDNFLQQIKISIYIKI